MIPGNVLHIKLFIIKYLAENTHNLSLLPEVFYFLEITKIDEDILAYEISSNKFLIIFSSTNAYQPVDVALYLELRKRKSHLFD